jgi:hypothetical protein
MSTLLDFVLNTLEDPTLTRDLNYQFETTRVYPSGYREIARAVRGGRIFLTTNPSDAGFVEAAGLDGAFAADTPAGTRHPMFISPRMVVTRGGVLHVRDGQSPYELSGLRGTIVHEATHALQDYQRLGNLNPFTSEGAALLADGIARRTWHDQTKVVDIHRPIAYALFVADWFLQQTHTARYVIPPEYVLGLKQRATTGAAGRYCFNGI